MDDGGYLGVEMGSGGDDYEEDGNDSFGVAHFYDAEICPESDRRREYYLREGVRGLERVGQGGCSTGGRMLRDGRHLACGVGQEYNAGVVV